MQRASAIQVQIYPQWMKAVTIQWSVPPSWGPVLFNVYFSAAQDVDLVKLNSTPINGTFFTDTTSQEYSIFNHGYYVVEAILTSQNNVTLRSNPVTWKTAQRDWVFLRAVEIQRREYWLLSRFAGIGTYLFRRRNYGRRCVTCWDPVTEQVFRDNCPDCIGTSFEGGYFDPVKIYLQYDPIPTTVSKNYLGQDEEATIGAWTISMPDIRQGDVLIRTGDWKGFQVLGKNVTELQGNTMRQMLSLTELHKGAVEFELVARNLPDFPTQYLENYPS
jgi:hypothetical protein